MPFNATQFRKQLKHGGARPNMFEIIITPTTKIAALMSQSGIAANDIKFMANSAQMPGAIVGTVPVPYFGRIVNVSGDRVYEDWQCSIYSDEDFGIRNFFEKWNDMMSFVNYDTNQEHMEGGVNDYVCEVDILHYTKTGDVDKRYKLHNAFPHYVSQVELSWQANDQLMMFEVAWKYDYFTTSWAKYEGKSITGVTTNPGNKPQQ